MALRRFYLENKNLLGDQIAIDGDLLHHIRDVCRFAVGDKFEVLPGNGEAWLVEVRDISSRVLNASILSKRTLPPLPKPYVTLCLSIPKLPKVDWIAEKCVELGVAEIRPFVSDYSFLRKESEISPNRLARWQKLVQGATQQSGRGDLMQILPAVKLSALLEEFNRTPGVAGLFPYEGVSQLPLRQALGELKKRAPERVWVFVGSEGGFSQPEVEMFANSGLNPVTMGDQILRVETACVALVSVIKYEL